MVLEEFKTKITELLPSASFEEGSEFLTANVNAPDWPAFAAQLRHHPSFQFDCLFCLTCIDWKTHLTMVYFFTATENRQKQLVVKIKLDSNKPEVETVSNIWHTAEFNEREVYEMFGVNFLNHPDLRLLILPDGWEGKNPLKKDFEDPVNMIRL